MGSYLYLFAFMSISIAESNSSDVILSRRRLFWSGLGVLSLLLDWSQGLSVVVCLDDCFFPFSLSCLSFCWVWWAGSVLVLYFFLSWEWDGVLSGVLGLSDLWGCFSLFFPCYGPSQLGVILIWFLGHVSGVWSPTSPGTAAITVTTVHLICVPVGSVIWSLLVVPGVLVVSIVWCFLSASTFLMGGGGWLLICLLVSGHVETDIWSHTCSILSDSTCMLHLFSCLLFGLFFHLLFWCRLSVWSFRLLPWLWDPSLPWWWILFCYPCAWCLL